MGKSQEWNKNYRPVVVVNWFERNNEGKYVRFDITIDLPVPHRMIKRYTFHWKVRTFQASTRHFKRYRNPNGSVYNFNPATVCSLFVRSSHCTLIIFISLRAHGAGMLFESVWFTRLATIRRLFTMFTRLLWGWVQSVPPQTRISSRVHVRSGFPIIFFSAAFLIEILCVFSYLLCMLHVSLSSLLFILLCY
jgi:hypothetical protein